jgi:hypothetical protein
MHAEQLLKSIGISDDIITAFTGETAPDNADELIAKARQSLFDLAKNSKDYKDHFQSEVDRAYKANIIKHIKDHNRLYDLGYTNAEMEKFASFADYLKEANDKITKHSVHDDEVKSLRARLTDVLKERDELNDKIAAAQTEKEAAIKEATDRLQAESYYMQMVQNDKDLLELQLPNKDFLLKSVRKEIQESVKINPDGTISAHDGSPFEMNGRVVQKLDDFYKFKKEEAGLVKKSNAGTGGNGAAPTGGAGGVDLDNHPDVVAAMQRLQSATRVS